MAQYIFIIILLKNASPICWPRPRPGRSPTIVSQKCIYIIIYFFIYNKNINVILGFKWSGLFCYSRLSTAMAKLREGQRLEKKIKP